MLEEKPTVVARMEAIVVCGFYESARYAAKSQNPNPYPSVADALLVDTALKMNALGERKMMVDPLCIIVDELSERKCNLWRDKLQRYAHVQIPK